VAEPVKVASISTYPLFQLTQLLPSQRDGALQGSVEFHPDLAKIFEQLGHVGACLKAISRKLVGAVVPAGVKSWRRQCSSANPDEVAKTPDLTVEAALLNFGGVSNLL
jgi:hypothetical protein